MNSSHISHFVQCPQCKNSDVETCLFSKAIDLGTAGKDINFGYGLIQAEESYLCLRDEVRCCGESGTQTSPTPPSPPTPSTSAPTAAPTSLSDVPAGIAMSSEDMITVSILKFCLILYILLRSDNFPINVRLPVDVLV